MLATLCVRDGIAVAVAVIRANESRILKENDMNRLATIVDRQSKSRVRDAIFALLVVVAGSVSLAGVTTAVHAAKSEIAQR